MEPLYTVLIFMGGFAIGFLIVPGLVKIISKRFRK